MPELRTAPTISVVVPFHHEEPNVIELYGRLQGVLEELGRSYQYEADFNPLHMNWALVDDTKGNPRLQMRWVVDR
jgi:hypothetical protein